MNHRTFRWDAILTTLAMVTLTLGLASVPISIPITSAEVTELNVNPQVVDLYGDVITISGNATPGEEVWLSSSFELLLPVSNGEYSREFIGIDFPAGEKEFSVTAENVKNIRISLYPVFWRTIKYPLECPKNATDGVVTLSVSFPAELYGVDIDVHGKKNVEVYGDAAEGGTSVNLKVATSINVPAGPNGDFELDINTEGVPGGEFLIAAGGIKKKVYIGVTPSPPLSPTPTPTPPSSGGGGGGGGGSGAPDTTLSPSPSPSPPPTPSPSPTPTSTSTPKPTSTPPAAPGGAPPVKTPKPTQREEEKTYENIAAGEEVKVELLDKELEITFKNDVSGVKISAKELVERPADMPDAPGIISKYLEYNIENAELEDVERVTIPFDVPKLWITSENIEPATVKLNRYYEGMWNPLPTEKVGEDANNILYSAEAEGLSIFAITGEKKKEALSAAIWVWRGLGVVLVIVVIAGVCLHIKKKRK